MFSLALTLTLVCGALGRETWIVNGDDADIADYPWQGSYRTASNSHTCGCVFVGGTWVLTAAHCGGSSSYSMEFGGSDRGSGTVFGINTVTLHPEYGVGAGFSPNDVAVVLATEEVSGANISPATLAQDATNPGGEGVISGWGRTCGSCALPVTLQAADVPINSDEECEEHFNGDTFYYDRTNMICIGGGSNNAVSCNGDSGGPLTVGSTLYGITSWGWTGCPEGDFGTYAKVGTFTPWICEQTNNEATGC